MADPTGQRLAALEAAFKEFKDAVAQRIDSLKDAISNQSEAVREAFSRIDRLLWWVIGTGITAVVSLWLGFGVLYKEISGLDTRIVRVETKLDVIQSTTASFSQAVTSIPAAVSDLKSITSSARSNAEAPGTLNIPVFDQRQLDLIRNRLGKEKGDIVAAVDNLQIGDSVKDLKLLDSFQPVPSDLSLGDVPQLRETKFVIGVKFIVIARVADSRIVAVVSR